MKRCMAWIAAVALLSALMMVHAPRALASGGADGVLLADKGGSHGGGDDGKSDDHGGPGKSDDHGGGHTTTDDLYGDSDGGPGKSDDHGGGHTTTDSLYGDSDDHGGGHTTTDSLYGDSDDSTTDHLYGSNGGNSHHREAVEKVLGRLELKITWLNPKAAANVTDVIYRLRADLIGDGPDLGDDEAEAAVTDALYTRKGAKIATPQELDVLAHLQAKHGDVTDAIYSLEERLELDDGAKEAYRRLGELYRQKGKPAYETFVGGKKVTFDVRPVLQDGRTLVPVRAITEALGAVLTFEASTGTITVTRGETVVQLTLGSPTALVNGKEVKLEVPAQVVPGNRTVVPMRFLAEALGMQVTYLPDSQLIVMTDQPLVEGTTSETAPATAPETTPATAPETAPATTPDTGTSSGTP